MKVSDFIAKCIAAYLKYDYELNQGIYDDVEDYLEFCEDGELKSCLMDLFGSLVSTVVDCRKLVTDCIGNMRVLLRSGDLIGTEEELEDFCAILLLADVSAIERKGMQRSIPFSNLPLLGKVVEELNGGAHSVCLLDASLELPAYKCKSNGVSVSGLLCVGNSDGDIITARVDTDGNREVLPEIERFMSSMVSGGTKRFIRLDESALQDFRKVRLMRQSGAECNLCFTPDLDTENPFQGLRKYFIMKLCPREHVGFNEDGAQNNSSGYVYVLIYADRQTDRIKLEYATTPGYSLSGLGYSTDDIIKAASSYMFSSAFKKPEGVDDKNSAMGYF